MKISSLLTALGLLASVDAKGDRCAGANHCPVMVGKYERRGTHICDPFFLATLSPCPLATLYKTTTVTATHPVTVSKTVLAVPTRTVIKPVTSTVTTIEDVATQQVPSEVLITSTVVVGVTATAAPDQNQLNPRAACTPKTIFMSTVPNNVPDQCRASYDLSVGCECWGFTKGGKTTTMPQTTLTSTITKTKTVTPTSTQFKTATSFFTKTQTTVVPATLRKTVSTVFVPSLYTDVTTVSVTSTTTVAPPACAEYQTFLVVSGGSYDGQYLRLVISDSGAANLGFTSNQDEAQDFDFHSTIVGTQAFGNFYQAGSSTVVINAFDSGNNRVYLDPNLHPDCQPLQCSTSTSSPHLLYCKTQNGRDKVQTCPGSSILQIDSSINTNCAGLSLVMSTVCTSWDS